MQIGDGPVVEPQASARIIENALTVFRGRHRRCRPGWVDISGRPFLHVEAGSLTMVLRTPFQRVAELLPPRFRGGRPAMRYGVCVFAGAKVFSASWGETGTAVDLLIPGPWDRELSRIAGDTVSAPGEIALLLASAQAACSSTRWR